MGNQTKLKTEGPDGGRIRTHLPIRNTSRAGLITYDAKDPDTQVPADRAAAPAQGRAQRPGHPHRRRRLRLVERLRRPLPDAERGEAGGRRPEVQPLPHHRALLADAPGAADRPQPPFGAAWAASPRSPPARRATARCCPTPCRRSRGRCKLNGYSTAQFGKCHEVPVWETSPVGPFDAWPTGGGGFEYFYGFIGGEANQWYPTLYEGTTPVEPKKTPEEGYHLDGGHDRQGDGLDRAAEGARSGQAVLRLLRARRDPRAAPRAEGMGRQVQGQVRPGLGQAARGDHSPGRRSWASSRRTASSPRATRRSRPGTTCRRRSSRCCAAQMEVYAGFMEYTDHHVGRLLDGLEKLGILDDTLVYYIIGDNGASAEGTLTAPSTR